MDCNFDCNYDFRFYLACKDRRKKKKCSKSWAKKNNDLESVDLNNTPKQNKTIIRKNILYYYIQINVFIEYYRENNYKKLYILPIVCVWSAQIWYCVVVQVKPIIKPYNCKMCEGLGIFVCCLCFRGVKLWLLQELEKIDD